MRALFVVIAVAVAGCAASDPFAGAPRPLTIDALPGVAASSSVAVARTRGAYLIPWRDGGGLHARVLADDGKRLDRALGPGELVGVAGLADGFAVAVAEPGAIAVHFLAAYGPEDEVQRIALAGAPLPYLASDGTRVIVAATTGGEIAIDGPRPLYATLALAAPHTAPRRIDLGRVGAPPSLWGDSTGFVIAGKQLLDGARLLDGDAGSGELGADGVMATAPGEQIAAARIFRRPLAAARPARDDVSLDGKRWLALDGLAAVAASAGHDTLLQLDSGELERVGADLTLRARLPLPATGKLVAANDDVIVWAHEKGSAFAGLDASTATVRGAWIQLPAADRDSISVALGAADVLFAWNDSSGGAAIVKCTRVQP